jgi:hypothetical protein
MDSRDEASGERLWGLPADADCGTVKEATQALV